MPFTIKRLPHSSLYKVFSSTTHRPLSHKGLSKRQARKQQIAVSIAEGFYPTKKHN